MINGEYPSSTNASGATKKRIAVDGIAQQLAGASCAKVRRTGRTLVSTGTSARRNANGRTSPGDRSRILRLATDHHFE